ncbi:MAG: hypothetical protein J3K34DRAFT_461663 [Monoraphidium minutum]|nr:MAG: hypothetical protein J3K34DRAFT_461663 [Monoraphidium minutum]
MQAEWAVRPLRRGPPALMLQASRRGRCPAHRARAASPAGAAAGGAEQPLREWLAREGGLLHPALRLVDDAPCGSRGVVAAQAVSLDDLEAAGPLVVVPKDLHLENTTALRLLESWAGAAAAEDLAARMSSAMLVAVALAHEAALGPASRWAPYLASLPAQPPGPWLLPSDAVAAAAEAALARRPPNGGSGGGEADSVAAWVAAAAEYRRGVDEEVAAAAAVLAGAAAAAEAARARGGGGGWLDAGLLTWALGHVESRSLGTAGSSGLVPVIDLLNHSPAARPPMLQLDDADRLVVTVLPTAAGAAAPLPPGGELLISYGRRAPLEGWLKFGFVSDEWWREEEEEGGGAR